MSGALPVNAVSANGVGVVPDSLLNAFVQGSGTASQLRGFIGLSGMSVMLQGTTAPGDGNSGLFYWATGNFTDDGIDTIVPYGAVGQGAWLRLSANAYFSIGDEFANGSMHIALTASVNGGSPQTEFQATQGTLWATQGIASAVVVPAGTTISEADAVFGAIQNSSTITNSVAGRFQARAQATGAAVCFGMNVQAFDEGFHTLGIIGCEWDINAGNTATPTFGSNYIGIFENGTPTECTAVQVSILDAPYPWGAAFSSLNGAAITALSVGASGTLAGSDSQSINMLAIANNGTQQQVGILAQATSNGADLLFLTPNGGVVINQIEVVEGLASFFGAISVGAASDVLATFYTQSTIVAAPTAVGNQVVAATTLDVSSTTNVAEFQTVSGPSGILPGTTVVSVVDPTHVQISQSVATLIASGTTIDFNTVPVQVGEISTDGTNITVGAIGGMLEIGSTPGKPLKALSPLQLPSYTIAAGANSLPAASATYAGCVAYVTDFSGAPTYHGSVGSGGGTTGTPVFCNGSAWLTD
jgi:hypothetical protein